MAIWRGNEKLKMGNLDDTKKNKKRILAILGSPHTKGTTANMLAMAIKRAEEAGAEVEYINLYEKNIKFCTGCRLCQKTGECHINDDIPNITKSIKKCDMIFLAAPVYWANVPGIVKNLFDRLNGVGMMETETFPKPRLRGRQYMLFTACNTPSPFSYLCGQSSGMIRNAKEFFKTSGVRCAGIFVCSNTKKSAEVPNKIKIRIEKEVAKWVS